MSQYPQLNLADVKAVQATIKTNQGDIKLQLFPDQAPKTVKNFVELAKQGYYKGATRPGPGPVVNQSTAKPLKTNSPRNSLTSRGPFRWPMLVLTPMGANSSS